MPGLYRCTSHYSRLEKPTMIPLCHPRKTTTYILRVVSVITRTHDRRKSIGEKKQGTNKKRKERKEKKAKKENEKGKKIEEKTRKARKGKTKRGSKERKRRKKMSYEQTLGTGSRRHWAHRGHHVHHQMALRRIRNIAKKLGQSYAIL